MTLYGASGGSYGSGQGGNGAMISSTIPVIAGEVYRVYVGGAGSNTAGGFNGGGMFCVLFASDVFC